MEHFLFFSGASLSAKCLSCESHPKGAGIRISLETIIGVFPKVCSSVLKKEQRCFGIQTQLTKRSVYESPDCLHAGLSRVPVTPERPRLSRRSGDVLTLKHLPTYLYLPPPHSCSRNQCCVGHSCGGNSAELEQTRCFIESRQAASGRTRAAVQLPRACSVLLSLKE